MSGRSARGRPASHRRAAGLTRRPALRRRQGSAYARRSTARARGACAGRRKAAAAVLERAEAMPRPRHRQAHHQERRRRTSGADAPPAQLARARRTARRPRLPEAPTRRRHRAASQARRRCSRRPTRRPRPLPGRVAGRRGSSRSHAAGRLLRARPLQRVPIRVHAAARLVVPHLPLARRRRPRRLLHRPSPLLRRGARAE